MSMTTSSVTLFISYYFLLRQQQGWPIHQTSQLQIGLYLLGAKWISAALPRIWKMHYRKLHVISHYPNLSIHLPTFKNDSIVRDLLKSQYTWVHDSNNKITKCICGKHGQTWKRLLMGQLIIICNISGWHSLK